MSSSMGKSLTNLRDADQTALYAIVDLIEDRNQPPVIDSLNIVRKLMDESERLEFAFRAGRASVARDIRAAINAIDIEQGG